LLTSSAAVAHLKTWEFLCTSSWLLIFFGFIALGAGGAFTLSGPPAKAISFFGQNVTVAGASGDCRAAVIEESGGGDLYGAQFISGAGGSVDTLREIRNETDQSAATRVRRPYHGRDQDDCRARHRHRFTVD
jgi:hypothetical protein